MNLSNYILNAFFDRWQALKHDRAELAARIARRHRVQLNRPPRAFCIPLRASDTRINPYNVSFAFYPNYERRLPHTIIVYGDDLHPLIAPVRIEPGGETAQAVADKLGTTVDTLRSLVRRGFFCTRRIPLYAGKRGIGTLFLSHDGWLDPCSRSFQPPDPVWGCLFHYRHLAIPESFEQDLRREPLIQRNRWGRADFMGWQWVCPACSRRVDQLYFPVPVPYVEDYLRIAVSSLDIDATPDPVGRFACARCHHVSTMDRSGSAGWNYYVTHLTCGLLYGHEVPRPDWWTSRKTAPYRKPHYKPSARKKEVRDLLVQTEFTCEQIAISLGITRGAVKRYASDVYNEYDVHSREDLRKRVRMMEQEKENQPRPALKIADAG